MQTEDRDSTQKDKHTNKIQNACYIVHSKPPLKYYMTRLQGSNMDQASSANAWVLGMACTFPGPRLP